MPAFINLDFADVRSVMKDAGHAHMGVGSATGANKAEEAAQAAISSPLLETSISGARGVIINITSSPDIGLEEVDTAASLITSSAHPDANIIWGAAVDEAMNDEMRITVIATGFENQAPAQEKEGGIRFSGESSTGDPIEPFNPFSSKGLNGGVSFSSSAEGEQDDGSYYDDVLTLLNNHGKQ